MHATEGKEGNLADGKGKSGIWENVKDASTSIWERTSMAVL